MNHFLHIICVSHEFCHFVSVLSLFENSVQQAYDCSLGYLNFLCVSGAYWTKFTLTTKTTISEFDCESE